MQTASEPSDQQLPTGTVTFLFTDIEGSTALAQRYPDALPSLLAQHHTILHQSIAAHHGHVFQIAGDAFSAAFFTASDAVLAALVAQRRLHHEAWDPSPVKVRMGIHTGAAQASAIDSVAGGYVGYLTLTRTQRIMSAAHGGQTLLSAATQELVRDQLPPDMTLRDMGAHRLKDLTRPEHLFQLVAADLPAVFLPLKTLDLHPHNLPVQPTAFIGREQAIASISSLLQRHDVRLLTLTGPGGTGKTRLSIQVAAELLDRFADGVWFVNLAPISESDLVLPAIVQTLGMRETSDRSLLDQLKDYLQERQLLLLLDNVEQVVSASPLISELLATAAQLKVLVTSRVALHLSGEHEIAVSPLSLPDRAHLPAVERLTQYEAVRLFVERAQAVNADFAVTNANAPAVAEICARLDGLPLAIELAAARSKLFTPQALLARLERRLKLLTSGARDLPARQQTLRNTIAWSYDLLAVEQQVLFARLAVFVGGWTLEAAEALCAAHDDLASDVFDGIAALVDQSLVRQIEGLAGEPRFTMLETIREYAWDRLSARAETMWIEEQHANYFLALAEEAESYLWSVDPDRWLMRLEAEHDNVRAALEWFTGRAETEQALRLAGALALFWQSHEHMAEGRRWLPKLLTMSSGIAAPIRAKALLGATQFCLEDLTTARGYIAESLALYRALSDTVGTIRALHTLGAIEVDHGNLALAKTCVEESLRLCESVADTPYPGWALLLQGRIALHQGDAAQAASYGQRSLAIMRRLGNRRGVAGLLTSVGDVYRLEGDYQRAVVYNQESLALCREIGNKGMTALVLHNLGHTVLRQGDQQYALDCFAEGLRLSRDIGDRALSGLCLAGMASMAAVYGQPERATRLFSAAEAQFDALSYILEPQDRSDNERNLAIAREQLSEELFSDVWAAGRALTLEQATIEALGPTSYALHSPHD